MVQRLIAGLVGILMLSRLATAVAEDAAARPNIVLIMADDKYYAVC